jgi:hypothetical protein
VLVGPAALVSIFMSRLLAIAGVALTFYLAVIGQFGPDPELSKISLTVSDFAVSDRGGATDTAMVTFGASAIVLLFALRPKRVPSLLLGLFGVAMLVAAIAPTDEGTHLSTAGYVHRYASMAAFIALPVAALLITTRRAVKAMCYGSFAIMMAMAASSMFAGRAYIGLIERVLLVLALAIMLALTDESARVRRSYWHDDKDSHPVDRRRYRWAAVLPHRYRPGAHPRRLRPEETPAEPA